MAKRVLKHDVTPDRRLAPRRLAEASAVTREMLVHALHHPSRDVRLEAARRMCGCMNPAFAIPLANWLMAETGAPDYLASMVVNETFQLPERTERTMAILVLATHPSMTVQTTLTKHLTQRTRRTLPMGSR